MNYLGILILLSLFSCQISNDWKYYEITHSSKSTFPSEKIKESNSIVRLKKLNDKIICEIIKNDNICMTKSFVVKQDSIVGNWNSLEDYTFRLLLPKLKIKHDNSKQVFSNVNFKETKGVNKWIVDKDWGIGLRSNSRSKIEFKNSEITIDSEFNHNTPARVFKGTSRIIIREVRDFSILKFDLEWTRDCI